MATQVLISYQSDTRNRYKVPKKQWAKWNADERRIFNQVYSAMTRQPRFFQHPEILGGQKIKREHWRTTAFNAAWEAAHAARSNRLNAEKKGKR